MNLQARRDICRKLKVFEHAAKSGNIAFICKYLGVSRDTFYQWRRAYAARGEKGLINSKLRCVVKNGVHPDLSIDRRIFYKCTNYRFSHSLP